MRVLEHHPALPPTPRCEAHRERFSGCCEECGAFFCPRCAADELCTPCSRRIPGIASAVVRHEGAGLLASRARAAMLDGVLVMLLWLVAHLALRAGLDELGTWGTRALLLALPVLFLAYHVLLEGLLGTTLGKSRFRLRVVDRRGRSPGPWRALRRNLYRLAPLPLAVPALSSARRSKTLQHAGDVRAGTFVLPASALPRSGAQP